MGGGGGKVGTIERGETDRQRLTDSRQTKRQIVSLTHTRSLTHTPDRNGVKVLEGGGGG